MVYGGVDEKVQCKIMLRLVKTLTQYGLVRRSYKLTCTPIMLITDNRDVRHAAHELCATLEVRGCWRAFEWGLNIVSNFYLINKTFNQF